MLDTGTVANNKYYHIIIGNVLMPQGHLVSPETFSLTRAIMTRIQEDGMSVTSLCVAYSPVCVTMPGSLDDYEVISTIGSGSYGTCQKIRRKRDGKV